MPRSTSRRHFVTSLGVAAAAALGMRYRVVAGGAQTRASALAPGNGTGGVTLAVLDLGADHNGRSDAIASWERELQRRTAVPISLPTAVSSVASIGPTWRDLKRYPLVILCGQGPCRDLSANELGALGRFLAAGGTLLIDTLEPALSARFHQSIAELTGKLAIGDASTAFEPIGGDHVIYRSFYALASSNDVSAPAGKAPPGPWGRVVSGGPLQGISLGSRLAIVYSRNDLMGALLKKPTGEYALPCEPGGEAQRERAIRLMVNIAMYALCLDYKNDQAHLPALLQQRRWQPNDGATPLP